MAASILHFCQWLEQTPVGLLVRTTDLFGISEGTTRTALSRMVAAGESTGKIDAMLEKMADFWDEEIEATLAALTSLLEPLLIVFLGVIVGGIVIAMFLPIFKLNDVVSANK